MTGFACVGMRHALVALQQHFPPFWDEGQSDLQEKLGAHVNCFAAWKVKSFTPAVMKEMQCAE